MASPQEKEKQITLNQSVLKHENGEIPLKIFVLKPENGEIPLKKYTYDSFLSYLLTYNFISLF